MNRRAPIVVHLDESISAAEMPWKRLAVYCMRYLSREQIEAACVAAGFARPAFTASGEALPAAPTPVHGPGTP